jgi:hypothetical protein
MEAITSHIKLKILYLVVDENNTNLKTTIIILHSTSLAFDRAEANSPVGTATIPNPIINTTKVKTFPPRVA